MHNTETQKNSTGSVNKPMFSIPGSLLNDTSLSYLAKQQFASKKPSQHVPTSNSLTTTETSSPPVSTTVKPQSTKTTNNKTPKKKGNRSSNSKELGNFVHSTTLLSEGNTPPPQSTTALEPTQFENWTKEEAFSILCSAKGKGGAGLTVEKVKPLYDTGFKGTSIANIVSKIQDKDKYFAIDRLATKYPTINPDTLETVVNWVDNLLKTRLHHLWSAEQVKEQLCKPVSQKGAGIQKSQLEHLTLPLEEFFETSESKSSFIMWKENNKLSVALYQKKKYTPDSIISARTDPKFNYLRDLTNRTQWKKLEGMIGKQIPLPVFGPMGSEHVPKDYDPKLPYLLTRQRFEILKQVVDREQDGYVLSGPQGVSKSYTMYLLAAYAIINSIPLLYVPKCRIWVSSYKFGMVSANNYLRSLVLYWNSDILTNHHLDQLEQNTDVVSYLSKNVACNLPTFYLFDEHNELFNTNIVRTDNYFREFSQWTGITSGDKTMTVYCGSAHSKFENYLPRGATSKVIRITPPTFSEFKELAKDFGFGNLDERNFRKVEYATGRIPGEMKLFSKSVLIKNFTDNEIRKFMNGRKNEYLARLSNMQKENPSEIHSFFNTIHHLFNLAFVSDSPKNFVSRGVYVDGNLYDQGILFKNSDSKLYPINEPAKRALFSFYISNDTKFEIKSLELGCAFERQLIKNEYKKGNMQNRFLLIGGASEIIKYHINSQGSFDLKTIANMGTLSRKRWLEGESILFVPESEQFPAIDYLIVTYESNNIQIVLKQATISTVKEHYEKGDFIKLLMPMYLVEETKISKPTSQFHIKRTEETTEYTYSLFELIIHSILDNYNTCSPVLTVEEKKDTKIETQTKLRKKTFNYNYQPVILNGPNIDLERSFSVNGVNISWYFVYESFKRINEQQINIKHNFVNYRNREDLEENLDMYYNDTNHSN